MVGFFLDHSENELRLCRVNWPAVHELRLWHI